MILNNLILKFYNVKFIFHYHLYPSVVQQLLYSL
jgi:hypothetical protein